MGTLKWFASGSSSAPSPQSITGGQETYRCRVGRYPNFSRIHTPSFDPVPAPPVLKQ